MATVVPFRGLRYDPKHIGALSQVIAPPHDAIHPALQTELYERHPANVVRLELNREEPGDDEHSNRSKRAARLLRQWREQGVLMREPAAALYVCHQQFEHEGTTLVRRGFLARVRLDESGSDGVGLLEETMPEPVEDRRLLMRSCRANVSPVLGLYPDEAGETQALLDAAIAGQPPVEATDPEGVKSRLWPVIDEALAAKVSGLMGRRHLCIADGSHRYEAARAHRDAEATAWAERHGGATLPDDHPAHFMLMMLVAMGDPGLVVLPTHRLFIEPSVASAAELAKRLGGCFTTRTSWRGPEAVEAVWSNIDLEGDQGVLGLYTSGDRAWTLARITPAGRARLDAVAADHGAAWRGLGIGMLQRLVVGDLLGCRAGAAGSPAPLSVHRLGEVQEALESGRYGLGALSMPASLADVRAVSQAGDRLPPRSTCFGPHVAAGLVINPLE